MPSNATGSAVSASMDAAASDGAAGAPVTASSVVAGVTINDAKLAAALRTELLTVENLLVDRINSGEKFLSEVAVHLVQAGGKRFRPLLTLMAGHLGPHPDSDALVRAGVACEMVHLATLYHDDVMDEAEVRRGVPAANVQWTNSMAILAGDFLFAHASMLLAEMGAEAVGAISDTFAQLVTGQMRETVGRLGAADNPADTASPEEHYLQVIWEKTGSLIATAARFGGMYSGLPEDDVERLGRMGDAVGMAFQIADDIIDIASTSSTSGKVPGTDLREGIATLPVLYALEGDDPAEARLRELVSAPISDDDEVDEALQLLRGSEAMARARDTLQRYVAQAEAELASLPTGPANDALRALVHFAVSRVG